LNKKDYQILLDPRERPPMFASNPMIIKIKKLIPHQRANTRDLEIRSLVH